MEKTTEDKFYHVLVNGDVKPTNEQIELTLDYTKVNLSWDEIQPHLPQNQPKTEFELSKIAQSEMQTELYWVDLQLKYHSSNDTKRMISTIELLNAYAIECRDYVQNVESVLTIVGDKPVRPE